MNFVVERKVETLAFRAWVDGGMVFMELTDGRVVGFSISRSSRLRAATAEELDAVRVSASGYALRWDAIDEDIRVGAVMEGIFELPLSDIEAA